MFAKAFRVNSNTVIKGSDRRKLRADISAAFPSAEDLNELIPNKDELNIGKIYAHKGDAVTLYILHKNPIFFQLEKQVMYTLWRYPTMLPVFVTWPLVLRKLTGGADLMLSGVVVPADGLPEETAVLSHLAPVAIGTAAVSSAEMRNSGMKGKGVNILHTYMDQAFGDKSHPPVKSVTNSPAQVEGEPEGEECEEEEQEVQDSSDPAPVETSCQSVQELRLDEYELLKVEEPQMDELLLQCFLHALKTKVKKSEFPLLTSTFKRNHMVSCCPKGKYLDIKKIHWSQRFFLPFQLSKFLQYMQKNHSLIQVKELSKGVESIVEVDWRNPELCSFSIPEDFEPEKESEEGGGAYPYQPPEITPLYGVTACLEPLTGCPEKGTPLKASEVRNIITEYVKKNELVHETNKKKSEYQQVEKLKWDDLFSRTLIRMQACHEVLFPGQPPVVKKGQMEPIDITVASRGSNKKASTKQQLYQAMGVYQIPRKYVQGLDKAPNPGKKK
uniref:Eukaryotic translation initiation factor 2D n=1 Tax=Sinocyclocheilus anshuiensis TaxID=1608454 RepID=A0A671KM09_9TELE